MKITTILLAVILALLCAAAFFYAGLSWEKAHYVPPQPVVDTLVIHDTVKLVETKPAGTVVVKLPVHDTVYVSHETVVTDSVMVEVPIEQKTYKGDNYKAVVQGFRPELVSIDVFCPVTPAPAPKRKWWSVTIGPQVGYGFSPAGWQPYAGVGVTAGISF